MNQRRVVTAGVEPPLLAEFEKRLARREPSYEVAGGPATDPSAHTDAADCVVCAQSGPTADTTGLSVLSSLRTRHPKLALVFLAGDGSERLAQRAFRAGVTEYVSRGIEGDTATQLADAVVRALERSGAGAGGRYGFEQFQLAVEQAGQSIYITDSGGIIQYVNPAFEALLGYERAAAVGETPALFHPDDADHRWWERMWAEEPRQGEVRKQHESGRVLTLDQTVAPVMDRDGRVQRFVVVQRDISTRRAHERHLQVLNRVFRHNVRNILTRINLGRTEDADGGDADVADIEAASEELLALSETAHDINQLLLQRDPEWYPTLLAGTCKRIVERYRERFPSATVAFTADQECRVLAHPLVENGLSELVENGLVHDDSTTPRVEVTVMLDGDHARARITDTGVGIPPAEAKVLRDDVEITQLRHGSGLGLWLAYWTVEKSGGYIEVPETGANGRGTTVEVVLPLAGAVDDGGTDERYFESTPGR